MEHTPHGPERDGPPLTQTELGLLFLAIANTLVKKGNVETVPYLFTPEDRPGSLMFHAALDPLAVKEIFYTNDEDVEILTGPEMTYMSYTTPGALDKEELEDQASEVFIGICGAIEDTDVTFQALYMLSEGMPEQGVFKGSVSVEYSRGEGFVDIEFVETERLMMMLRSERRELNADDSQKIRQLLEGL